MRMRGTCRIMPRPNVAAVTQRRGTGFGGGGHLTRGTHETMHGGSWSAWAAQTRRWWAAKELEKSINVMAENMTIDSTVVGMGSIMDVSV